MISYQVIDWFIISHDVWHIALHNSMYVLHCCPDPSCHGIASHSDNDSKSTDEKIDRYE